jgi:hypothetical protein
MLSALITTPPHRSARARASLDLPLAVGPAITMARPCTGHFIGVSYAWVEEQINLAPAPRGFHERSTMRIDASAVGVNPPEDVNVIVEVPIGGE